MRLIDADEVIKSYRELIRSPYLRENSVRRDGADYIIDFCVKSNFGKENTIDPVKHGRWSYHEKNGSLILNGVVCSVCDGFSPEKTAYCPECGAKMENEWRKDYETD